MSLAAVPAAIPVAVPAAGPDPWPPAPGPAGITAADFDHLHDDPAAWQAPIEALARRLGCDGPVQQRGDGTVLVALLGSTRVLKLYPPFLHDHFAFECATLAQLHGQLALPTPQLLQSGDLHGWPWLLMTQLAGQPLTPHWPALPEADKCRLLAQLGALVAQVQALPVGGLHALAPDWGPWLARQRQRCQARQQRTGLPAHLLARLDSFLAGPVPEGPAVILTGEFTPMNLLVNAPPQVRLCGLFDFGDGLVGPREYDWLGPLAFLAAGHAGRCRAFFDGLGVRPDDVDRQGLMRLLLLHRYSHLPAQIALPGWQQAPDFEALTAWVWPGCDT